jgi:hypothetical protein
LPVLASPKIITVCGFQFDQNNFHRTLKPEVLTWLKTQGVDTSRAGKNPDINCKQGKVILTGTAKNASNVPTDYQFAGILRELGYLK